MTNPLSSATYSLMLRNVYPERNKSSFSQLELRLHVQINLREEHLDLNLPNALGAVFDGQGGSELRNGETWGIQAGGWASPIAGQSQSSWEAALPLASPITWSSEQEGWDDLYYITETLFWRTTNRLSQVLVEKRVALPRGECWHLIHFEKGAPLCRHTDSPWRSGSRVLLLLASPMPKSKCRLSQRASQKVWGLVSGAGFLPIVAESDLGTPQQKPAQLPISLCVGSMVTHTQRYVYPKLAGAVYSRAHFANSGESKYLYAWPPFSETLYLCSRWHD